MAIRRSFIDHIHDLSAGAADGIHFLSPICKVWQV
jgi:hypothetical protein